MPGRWSLELSPTGLLKAGSVTARLLPSLPAGTRIYLPALPTDPPDAIERALTLLRREGAGTLIPVPHVAATRVESSAELERTLCAWQRASCDAVHETLVVRGDPRAHHGSLGSARQVAAAGSGPFGCSLDLLESGLLQRCGVGAVSLCGHPEGVGDLSCDAASAALVPKLQWADASGVAARVVTQFCFDAPTTTAYVDSLRALGVTAAVNVGLVGPSTLDLRTRMAARCGVALPMEDGIDGGGGGSKGKERLQWPSAHMRTLAAWQQARGPTAGVQAIHVYPFGGLARTLEWLHDDEGMAEGWPRGPQDEAA